MKIKTVIVTHFHQDHFTGMDYFPNAKFVIQRAELEFWTGPLMRHEIFDKQIRPKVRPALERLKQQGRIELIDGDFELYPGLELLKAGGHTPGSQMVALDTEAGKAVLCGDIAYTFKNIRDHHPGGLVLPLGRYRRRARSRAGYGHAARSRFSQSRCGNHARQARRARGLTLRLALNKDSRDFTAAALRKRRKEY